MTKRPRDELSAAVAIQDLKTAGDKAAKKRKTDETKIDVDVNGDANKSQLSKEERCKLKKLRKLTERDIDARDGKVDAVQAEEIPEAAITISKAARKAERARLKDERALTANGATNIHNLGRPIEVDTQAKSKVDRKAEKKRKKALQQVQRNGSVPEEANTIRQDNSGVLSIRDPASDGSQDQSYEENPELSALSDTEIHSFLSSNFITIKDPSSKNPLRPITKFSYLPKTSQSSTFSTFKAPTPVQASTWPFLLSGRDVVGVAETGSGKTLAFGIPCIRSVSHRLSSEKSKTPAKAVIISPTRELAVQIHDQIHEIAVPAAIKSVCVYGGVPKDPQRIALSTAHIIVATPGRLLDLIEEGSANLSEVKYFVLDEADRMLEKGFENDIRKIIATTPSTAQGRQTLMFTATWPESVRELAATFMNQPVHIHIGENNADGELRANTKIEQQVEVVDHSSKETRMLQIIKKYQSGKSKNDRILVFCLYKKEATRVEGFLRSKGLRVAGIHGDLSQERRMNALEGFKSGQCPLLVATDVAARGLDIPAVKLVLNVTFPLTVEDYVHRIGRTGRAGAQGLAITLFTEHDKAQSGALINVLRAAGQPVPEELLKFGTTVKKKGHEAYGAFYKDTAHAKTIHNRALPACRSRGIGTMPLFLDLPGEIRNRIYGYVFESDNGITPTDDPIKPLSAISTAPDLTLLYVNRQVYQESIPVVYIQNLFVVSFLDKSWLGYLECLGMSKLRVGESKKTDQCRRFAMVIDTTRKLPEKSGELIEIVFSSRDFDMFFSLLWLYRQDLPLDSTIDALLEEVTVYISIFTAVKGLGKSQLSCKLLQPFFNATPIDVSNTIDRIFESKFQRQPLIFNIFMGPRCVTIHHELRMTAGLLLLPEKNSGPGWKEYRKRVAQCTWSKISSSLANFMGQEKAGFLAMNIYMLNSWVRDGEWEAAKFGVMSLHKEFKHQRPPAEWEMKLTKHLYAYVPWTQAVIIAQT
ncbi:MAG: hypothetical protein Q9166_007290 [cf. Caloplaca sp. 2 TL-2023]